MWSAGWFVKVGITEHVGFEYSYVCIQSGALLVYLVFKFIILFLFFTLCKLFLLLFLLSDY
jgi:hypothetical protein